MKMLSFGSIALFAFMFVPAMAADLPVKAPVVKAPPVAVYNWTGFYIGGHAGYAWGDADSHIDFNDPVFAESPIPPAVPADYAKHVNGFIGGGQIGWNYQTGNLVAGVEADFSYSDINGDLSLRNTLVGFGGATFTYAESQRLRWFGTARGRIGVTPASNWLIYATGGFAYGKVNAETHLTFIDIFGVTSAQYHGAASTTRTGWTIGGGAEAAVAGNWTAKLEYLYYDLGSVEVLGVRTPVLPTLFTVNDQDVRGHIVRFGLNYRFGGPLVAKY